MLARKRPFAADTMDDGNARKEGGRSLSRDELGNTTETDD
jgi:hypothetical protein